ncbi:MAG: SDR family NAD(P)-dependent oxidoreductase [Bacteroidota bacterium]
MQKAILITGSTDGIGKLAAIALAKEGHKVYLHGRNAEKLAAVIAEVRSISNNNQIDGFVADFSDLEAVKTMGEQVNSQLDRLDVLINNAGVYKSAASTTEAGVDLRFVVNYFAPYLLTHAILPLLQKEKMARIINLSSAAQASVSLDALAGGQSLSTHDAYAQSKLALTTWSFHLAKAKTDLTVIAVNPGSLLNTRMVREGFGRVWSPADKGGAILYQLAVEEAYQNHSGAYFDNDQGGFGPAHADAYKQAASGALIQKTAEILRDYLPK